MNSREALIDLGLQSRQVTIYLELLSGGPSTPLKLSTATGIKRSTVYLVLEELRKKRLAGLTVYRKKTYYVAESPSQLMRLVEEQQRAANYVVPLLRSLENRGGEHPHVRIYDRPKDITRVFKSIWPFPDRCYLSNIRSLDKSYSSMLHEYFRLRKDHQVTPDRTIFTADSELLKLHEEHAQPEYPFHVLAPGVDFQSEIILWGNNIGIHAYESGYLLVITNDIMTKSFRALFDVVWGASMTPQIYRKKYGYRKIRSTGIRLKK